MGSCHGGITSVLDELTFLVPLDGIVVPVAPRSVGTRTKSCGTVALSWRLVHESERLTDQLSEKNLHEDAYVEVERKESYIMNSNVEWIACPCGVHVDDCTYHRDESWMPLFSIDAPFEKFMQFVEKLKTTSFRQIVKIIQRVDFVGEGPTKHRSVRIMTLNWILAELDDRDGISTSWDSRYQTVVCNPLYIKHFVTAYDDPRFRPVVDPKGRFCWPEVTEMLEAISTS